MAKGVTLPLIHEKSKEYQQSKIIDNKTIKYNEWRLPPLSYMNNLEQTQLITIKGISNDRKINKRDKAKLQGSSHTVTRKKHSRKHKTFVRAEKRKEMFANMSMEAREAYNQTLQEMAEEVEQSSSSNRSILLTNTCKFVDRLNMTPSSTYITDSESEPEVYGVSNRRHSDFETRYKYSHVLKSQQRLAKSESRSRRRQTEKIKKSREQIPLIKKCKAPVSHTALRIGRKQQVQEKDEDMRSDTLSRDQVSVHQQQLTTRPFEITPFGYDSRYMGVQNIVNHKQYNTDEDEDLAAYVIEKATQKCKHWLAYQNNDSL